MYCINCFPPERTGYNFRSRGHGLILSKKNFNGSSDLDYAYLFFCYPKFNTGYVLPVYKFGDSCFSPFQRYDSDHQIKNWPRDRDHAH